MFHFLTASALSVVSSRWPQRLSSESHLPLPSTQDRRVPRNRPAAPIAKTTVPTCPSEHNRCSTSYSKPLPHQQSRVYAKAACISECIVTSTGAGRINQSNRSSSRSRLPPALWWWYRWGTLVVHLKVLAYTGGFCRLRGICIRVFSSAWSVVWQLVPAGITHGLESLLAVQSAGKQMCVQEIIIHPATLRS